MATLFALVLLDPVSAALAAGLGGAGILFFYFLRLRRRPVRVSSTLLWLRSTSDLQVNVPFRWVRLSWLLLLQLAAMALLATAIGRPAVSDADQRGTSVILLLDRSASMAARSPDTTSSEFPTRFALAQHEASQLLRDLPSSTRVMLVGFATQASAITGFSRDRGMLAGALGSMSVTDEPADLDRAFELIRALAGQGAEGAGDDPPRVVLISDGGMPALAGGGGVGRSRLEFISVGGGETPPDNIGIVACSARRDYEDPSTVRVFVRVQSVVDREIALPVECRLGELVIDRLTLSLAPGKAGAPAEAAKTFEFQNTEGGVLTVTLGREDDLSADNTAGLVLRPPASVRITLVRPNIAVDALDEVVKAAIESLGPASLRVMNAGEYERSGAPGTDLFLFDRVRPATLPPEPSISFGATVPIPGLGVSEPPEGEGTATKFVVWLRSHPLMRYVVLNEIWVSRPMQVVLPAEVSTGPGLHVTPLATGESGPLIVLVEQGDVRRVIVGFDVGQSNWVKDAGFHIFLKNAVDYLTLTGEEEAGLILRTTDTFSVRPLRDAKSIDVTGPISFSREAISTRERVSLGPLPKVGLYEIAGVEPGDAHAAVDLLDSEESRIEVRQDLVLVSGAVQGTSASAAAPREIWHWFVLAALLVLCVEWMLYSWRMRV